MGRPRRRSGQFTVVVFASCTSSVCGFCPALDQQTAQMLKKPDHGLVSLDSAGTLLSLAKTTLGACGTTESLSLQHVRGGVAGARRALHTRKTHQDPESANETRPGLLWP